VEKHVLVTGYPGVGKTTLIRKVLQGLPPALTLTGFFTSEMREGGQRVGFEIETLDGRRGILSHVRFRSPHRVGRYGVDLEGFERLVLPLLQPGAADLCVVDEMGKMECLSGAFVRAVTELLDSGSPVFGSVALKGGGFIEKVKTRRDVTIVTVTAGTRDDVSGALLIEIRKRLGV
jgi:nucleoside-triphosphatase